MSEAAPIPQDMLLTAVNPDAQRQAAATVQDVFARVFRLAVDAEVKEENLLAELASGLFNWQRAGDSADARAARLALILSGLDQWGVAYAQAFDLAALPALTWLMGELRTRLNAEEDALLQQKFELLQAEESAAVDFKIELRRAIHLALWHAMIAGEDKDDALRVLACLGGALVQLCRAMPNLGWRLVADTLTHVQLRCLDGLAAAGLGQEMTQALFASLRQSLAEEEFNRIMALSGRVLIEWQQAKRPH